MSAFVCFTRTNSYRLKSEILHGNNFFRFPGSCSKTSARKKIKLFKYVTFEPQVIQRGAMQRK